MSERVQNFARWVRDVDADTLRELVLVMSRELSRREDDFRKILGPTLAPLLLPETATLDGAKGGTRNAQ